jgi:hypothetical protein
MTMTTPTTLVGRPIKVWEMERVLPVRAAAAAQSPLSPRLGSLAEDSDGGSPRSPRSPLGVGGSGGGAAAPPRIVAVELNAKDPSLSLCVSLRDPEAAAELFETLAVHLRRYNRARVTAVQQLLAHNRRRGTAYDSRDTAHEYTLLGMWDNVFPDDPLPARKCTEWARIGFQGRDPATDFRGMGVLGLDLIAYCARRYPALTREMATVPEPHDYPWAITGINLGHTMMAWFKLRAPAEVPRVPHPSSRAWDSLALHYLCRPDVARHPNPLEELFVVVALTFHRAWIERRATVRRNSGVFF